MKDIDDPVQRLLQLVVLLHKALFAPALALLSLVKFSPVLLEKLQGSLSIFLSHRHGVLLPGACACHCERVSVITDVCVCLGTASLKTGTPSLHQNCLHQYGFSFKVKLNELFESPAEKRENAATVR